MGQGDRDEERDEERARELRRAVSRALAEDLGEAGDVTSAAVVPPGTTATATIVARRPGVVAGIDAVATVYAQLDGRVEVHARVRDGEPVAGGEVLAELQGPLRSLLTGERVALNLLGHLSGVATLTHRFVTRIGGTDCRVRDTRKTTPGLRALEKAAVRAGGGDNHRMGLHDALLVKDNHIVAAGGAGAAARAALERADGRPVQVEVEHLDPLDDVLAAGVTDVLLDNFTLDQLHAAVERTAGRARLEASGGIDLETAEDVAATGVDRVAVGALTHSAPSLDVAMDIAASDVEVPAAFRRGRTVAIPEDDADTADPDTTGSDGTAPDRSGGRERPGGGLRGILDDDPHRDGDADDTQDIFSPGTVAGDEADVDGQAGDASAGDEAGRSDEPGSDEPGTVGSDRDDPEPLSDLFAERRAGDG